LGPGFWSVRGRDSGQQRTGGSDVAGTIDLFEVLSVVEEVNCNFYFLIKKNAKIGVVGVNKIENY
jgi:hypothetical protein